MTPKPAMTAKHRERQPRTDEHGELTDEARQSRKTGGCESSEEEEPGVDRHDRGEPSVVGDEPGVRPVVDHADQQEQHAGGEAVAVGEVDRALQTLGGEGEHAEHDEAHVTHGRVGDESLDVRLHDRNRCAVDDADHTQQGHPEGEIDGRIREEGHVEPHEPVRPHLEEDTGQDDRTGRRGLGVCVRQPGVEREQRHLDRKGDGESEEEPELCGRGQLQAHHVAEVEVGRHAEHVPGDDRQGDDRREQERRPGSGEQHELDRGVGTVLRPPEPDQHVHRDQDDLEEHEEEEQVERDEHAHDPCLEHEEEDHVGLDPIGHRPRRSDRQREEECRDADHEQRDTVDRHDPTDAERRDQRDLLTELERRSPDDELVRHVALDTYRAQRRGGKGRSGMSTKDEDFVTDIFVANTHIPLLLFSSRGIAYKLKVYRLPVGTPQARGRAFVNSAAVGTGRDDYHRYAVARGRRNLGRIECCFCHQFRWRAAKPVVRFRADQPQRQDRDEAG